MAGLVGEADDFVFDGRAVARAARLNLAGVHRSAVQIGADEFVNGFVGVRDPARQLIAGDFFGEEAEGLRIVVAGLNFAAAVIDGAAVQSAGCAGFEASEFEAEAV